MEQYRSGHNEVDSKSIRHCKMPRGFESHLLRQKRREKIDNRKEKRNRKANSSGISVIPYIINNSYYDDKI